MITVKPASEQQIPRRVHLLLCALGYERRSRFAAERTWRRAPRRIAFSFPSRGVLSFDENEIWFREHGFEIVEFTYDTMYQTIQSLCAQTRVAESDYLKVLIDISSMSRPMMANLLVHWFRRTEVASRLFLMYSPAVYVPPPTSLAPVTYSGPVIPQYAGWATNPDAPTCAVVGLGYEGGRALGALEFLEVAQAWLFFPRGWDRRYESAVRRKNADLMELYPADSILEYRLAAPFDLFQKLESLIYGALKSFRAILVPFGPKIFAAVALVVADIHAPNVSVWRVSGEGVEPPVDRRASGKLVMLEVQTGGGV